MPRESAGEQTPSKPSGTAGSAQPSMRPPLSARARAGCWCVRVRARDGRSVNALRAGAGAGGGLGLCMLALIRLTRHRPRLAFGGAAPAGERGAPVTCRNTRPSPRAAAACCALPGTRSAACAGRAGVKGTAAGNAAGAGAGTGAAGHGKRRGAAGAGSAGDPEGSQRVKHRPGEAR